MRTPALYSQSTSARSSCSCSRMLTRVSMYVLESLWYSSIESSSESGSGSDDCGFWEAAAGAEVVDEEE